MAFSLLVLSAQELMNSLLGDLLQAGIAGVEEETCWHSFFLCWVQIILRPDLPQTGMEEHEAHACRPLLTHTDNFRCLSFILLVLGANIRPSLLQACILEGAYLNF